MEVVNLVFAILGHVLASVLYMARRITSSGTTTPKAVVDRSSILDRKEEIKDLWERKMMASEQSLDHVKKEEEEPEKEQLTKESKSVEVHKIPNGTVIKGDADINVKPKDINENIEEPEKNVESPHGNITDERKLSTSSAKVEVEVCEKEMHLLETENEIIEEHVERQVMETSDKTLVEEAVLIDLQEQVYTTTHEQTIVTTITKEVSVVEEQQILITEQEVVSREDTQEDFEEIERRIEAEESLVIQAGMIQKSHIVEDAEFGDKEEKELELNGIHDDKEIDVDDAPDTVDSPDSLETIEIPDSSNDFEHYTVLDTRPKGAEDSINGDATQESLYSGGNSYVSEESLTLANGEKVSTNDETEEKTFDDHFVLDTQEAISPVCEEDKSDLTCKRLRIHTMGVQKTEQPYSTCTTETKIAMEIREMREREEELKVMRERQAQISPQPPPPQQQQKKVATPTKVFPVQKPSPQAPYVMTNNQKPISTPGYRVSSVFGSRGITQAVKEESKFNKNYNKETAVEKEIRLAKDREEELRKQKGLPPREDDSYVKPSQVKSSQAKAFGKMANAESSRLVATAKIQHEIQEQTMREMALRESGNIQTLSSERTDAKVTKLKTLELASPECTSPTFHNGNGHSNGLFTNGYMSPDSITSKRSTPSPTGSNYSQYSISRNVVSPNNNNSTNNNNKGISMQKFIASRGKETTFSACKNGPFSPKAEYLDNSSRIVPEPGKLKRTASVESKIQQEIMDMKLREDELRSLHTPGSTTNGNGYDNAMPDSAIDYHQNGAGDEAEEMCPRRSNLIAQWEQRIQKNEGKV